MYVLWMKVFFFKYLQVPFESIYIFIDLTGFKTSEFVYMKLDSFLFALHLQLHNFGLKQKKNQRYYV